MPQNEHIELAQKRSGRRLDYEERKRKKEARAPKKRAEQARKLRGIKAKFTNKERFKEKVQMKKHSWMTEDMLSGLDGILVETAPAGLTSFQTASVL